VITAPRPMRRRYQTAAPSNDLSDRSALRASERRYHCPAARTIIRLSSRINGRQGARPTVTRADLIESARAQQRGAGVRSVELAAGTICRLARVLDRRRSHARSGRIAARRGRSPAASAFQPRATSLTPSMVDQRHLRHASTRPRETSLRILTARGQHRQCRTEFPRYAAAHVT